jgi:hypothetical protein
LNEAHSSHIETPSKLLIILEIIVVLQIGGTTIIPGSQMDGLVFFKRMLEGISKVENGKKKMAKHQLYCERIRWSVLSRPSIFAFPY